MINKKVSTISGVAIIVIIVSIIGASILVQNKKIGINYSGLNNNKKNEKIECVDEWERYAQNTIGISFCYPSKWGYPETEPIKNITRLSEMEKTFKDQNIYYENSLDIKFKNNSQISIILFNDQNDGTGQRGFVEPYDYYKSSMTDNILTLKKDGNICSYDIYFPYGDNGGIRSLYSECNNGTKTILTEQEEFFYGAVYNTYDLRLLSFVKLNNGYFDNALITYKIDEASQIKEKITDLDGFFNKSKIRFDGTPIEVRSFDQFRSDQEEFSNFLGTISTYNPIISQQSEFKEIAGEDPNIEKIRRYYWNLENGRINDAYNMKNNPTTTPKEFNSSYENVNFSKPRDFKKIGDNIYEFYVDYQDYNSDIEVYRIRMKVIDSGIETIFVEKYLTNLAKYGNAYMAYGAERDGKNMMILQINGKELIIESKKSEYDEKYTNIGEVGSFGDPRFTNQGKYLAYRTSGWEYGGTVIYDIENQKEIIEIGYPTGIGFSKDDKYLFMCTSSGIGSGPDGEVHSLPDLDVKFDLVDYKKENQEMEFMNVDCEYDENKNEIIFELSDYYSQDKINKDKIVREVYILE